MKGYGNHRELHELTQSCPTRRSADLQRERIQRVEPGMKGMRGTGNDKASWPLAPRRSMWRGSLEVTAWLRPSLLIPYSPHSLFPSFPSFPHPATADTYPFTRI